jgi:hypothetical protein
MEYRNYAGESVNLGGAMENGTVPSVMEASAAPVSVAAPLAANASFQAMDEQLRAQGFSRNATLQNVTLAGAVTNLTYQDPQGKQAFINATTSGEDVTGISLAVDPDAPFDYVTVIAAAAVAVVAIAAAWVLYRRFRGQEKTVTPAPVADVAPPVPVDHRQAALDLLVKAEAAYADNRQADACGMAGQALRLFISYGNGGRREMTNTEILAFLESRNRETRRTREALALCTDVEFARGTINGQEFAVLISYIRGVVEGGE